MQSIALTRKVSQDSYEFLITCGGGTYIRSLCRDIAKACRTVATMTSLVREKSGIFTLETACTAEQLTPENWQEFLIAPDRVFDFPALDFDDEQARKLRNGLGVEYSRDGEYKLYLDDEFYGIACAEGGILRAKVKLV